MKEEFLNRLSALLEEYNAEIWFSCGAGSDTYGLYDDRITVSIKEEIVLDTESDWFLDSNNIKEHM